MNPFRIAPVTVKVVALATVACATQKAPESQGGQEIIPTKSQDELAALFEREMKLPKLHNIVSPDDSWSARVHALAPPTLSIDEDGMVSAKIVIAEDDSIDCFFYRESVDAGQAVSTMIAHLSKGVQFTRVAGYRVGAAAGYPVLFLEGLYLFEQESGDKAMGSVKLGLSPRFETPVMCLFDSPGYRETFATFMTDLLTSMRTREEATAAVFSEIWGYQMGDVPVGYEMMRVLRPGNGTTTNISLRASFVPVSTSELSTSDAVEVIVSDATGLLTGHFVKVENTRPEHDLELERKGTVDYRVKGTLKGKPFEAGFSSKDGLSDTVSFYQYLVRNRGKGGSLATVGYTPTIDASGTTTTHYELDQAGHDLSVFSGSSKLSAVRDESGLPTQLLIPIGDRELRGTLIYRTGALSGR